MTAGAGGPVPDLRPRHWARPPSAGRQSDCPGVALFPGSPGPRSALF
jgi:hypothetical protein